MKKSERYEKELRYRAFTILRGSTPEATCSQVVIEDITSKTEKGFINKLKAKLIGDIEIKKGFEMETAKEEKMIQILDSRMKVLNKN
jgi:hypothetical protein